MRHFVSKQEEPLTLVLFTVVFPRPRAGSYDRSWGQEAAAAAKLPQSKDDGGMAQPTVS